MAGYDGDGYDGGGYGGYDWGEYSDEDEACNIRGYDTAELVLPYGHPENVFSHCALLEFAAHEKERERQRDLSDIVNDLMNYVNEKRYEVMTPFYKERDRLAAERTKLPEGHPRIPELSARIAEIEAFDLENAKAACVEREEVRKYIYEYDQKIKDPSYDPYKDEDLQARLKVACTYLERRDRERELIKHTENAQKIIEQIQKGYGYDTARDVILPLLEEKI
jgi:hypothetical protein